MDDVKKQKYIQYAINISITIVFAMLCLVISGFHEHWSDEAQSFLLARDNSFSEIFHYIKYEGTPALWVIIIKIFILLGGTYETYYLLPIIFSTIGVAIFEFKIKAPWYIKLLLPFTYFILYQYSIVARSYCLVFPFLMIIASMYHKRLEKPILYSFILLLFMNVSLHTLILSGSLYLLFLIDLFRNKKLKEKKNIIASIIIFLGLLITMLYAMPYEDCGYTPKSSEPVWHTISEATIGSNQSDIVEIIISLIIVITISFVIIKNRSKENFMILAIFLIPVIAVLSIVTYQPWHVGIIFLSLLTYFIITGMLDKEKIIQYLFIIIFAVQIYWSANSILYDMNNLYSSSEIVADFLKENCEGSTIYGLGYSTTAIEPYFDHNIFANRNTNKAFNLWSKNNGYYTNEEMLKNKADVYVLSTFYILYYDDIIKALNDEGYTKYMINGYTYSKDHKYEIEGYIIYTKDFDINKYINFYTTN